VAGHVTLEVLKIPHAECPITTGGDFGLIGGFWAGGEAPFCFGDPDGKSRILIRGGAMQIHGGGALAVY
jgi:hypothetical protein